jgi:cell division protein FtsB
VKRQRVIIGAGGFLIIILVVILFSGDQGVVTFYRTWRQMQELQIELDNSRKAIDSLTVEIERLKNDTAYIERIAREKYGMARKNEKMYKFVEEK